MVWQWATGHPVEQSAATRPGCGCAGCAATCAGFGTTTVGQGGRTACPAAGHCGRSPPSSPGSTRYDCFDRRDLRPVVAEMRTTAAAVRNRTRNPPPPETESLGREPPMPADDVLIIGAGPFGLSISAHLRAAGIEHRIVGRPMDTWKAHCPPGMQLRSEPYGSDMAAPQRGYDVRTYCRDRGLDYVDRLGPLCIERFLEYADWYTDQLVPDVSDDVTGRTRPGLSATAQAASASRSPTPTRSPPARSWWRPACCRTPPSRRSWTACRPTWSRTPPTITGSSAFAGRRVAVVGGGQSALETAALLHEAGAETQVVMRRAAPNWLAPNPEHVRGLGYVKRPVNKLCEGWHCAVWNSPFLFRLLPQEMRITRLARSSARPVPGGSSREWTA